jgi:molybdenum cofactor biosynthesis enzyme MoaA
MEMVTLKTFDQYFSANILRSRLEAEGIICLLKDENTVTIDPLLSKCLKQTGKEPEAFWNLMTMKPENR